MTKQDFIAVAETLAAFLNTPHGKALDSITKALLIRHFSDMCEESNPRFDQAKWYKYVYERVTL